MQAATNLTHLQLRRLAIKHVNRFEATIQHSDGAVEQTKQMATHVSRLLSGSRMAGKALPRCLTIVIGESVLTQLVWPHCHHKLVQ